MSAQPLTIGTAGHVDHGKTALVAALTGVDTDRLPEEKARGLTIVLGYAPLTLPSGRRLSLIDVPGHERFVRTMIAGAGGIDLFIMAVAADDGVMPQTREHARVLHALAIDAGVIAITKSDVAEPDRAASAAAQILPSAPIVPCCAPTGDGLRDLLEAIERVAAARPSRSAGGGPARMHVDRTFTVAGRGTVVTGTLWSGAIARGDELELAPAGRRVRVRGVQVHDQPVQHAGAGQRVAVNLLGVSLDEVARGDLLASPGAVRASTILDCELELAGARHGARVSVHHGTRAVPGRLCELGGGRWQLRLERPLLALDGDRLVVRRLAPPDTLGGGVVLDADARRHGRSALAARAGARAGAAPVGAARVGAARAGAARAGAARAPAGAAAARREVDAAARLEELERWLREAGTGLLSEAQLGERLAELRALVSAGRAVRVSRRLYGESEVVAQTSARIVELIAAGEVTTLAGVRDALGLSRKSAQAFLEHLDGRRVTRRLPDDSRVLVAR